MPLTGKYLKYKPEITFEIFEKIWNKLIECGWEELNNFGIDRRFSEFKSGETLYDESDEQCKKFYINYKDVFELLDQYPELKETTVEEILGYDPFIKSKNQAVHCTTQEEWNFVLSKFNPQNLLNAYFNTKPGIMTKIPVNTICISYSGLRYDSNIGICGDVSCFKDYQILSFKEWCDLNNYKMEKEIKFEVGKWYRVTDGKYKYIGKDLWYAKSIVVLDNIVIAGEYWHNYLDTNGNFGTVGDYTFTEVPLSEIQQYLPDDHPDKIKNCVPPSELKVGMWVKITKSDIDWDNCMDKFIGQVVQINKVIDNNRIRFENDENWYWRYSNKHFEIVEPSCLTYSSNKWLSYIDFPKYASIYDYKGMTLDYWKEKQTGAILYGQQIHEQFFKSQTIREALEQLTNQSESIFPKFEIPEIDIKEEIISKDYFPKFKDPYINN